MSIQIVTDSPSDIPPDLAASLPITVVPVYINLNGKSYRDKVDLSREDFYRMLPDSNPNPTTAAPSPHQFLQAYQKAADEGAEAVFSLHISKSFSAIYESARQAAEQCTRIPVYPISTGNLTLAEGLVVIQAARAAQAGKTVDDIHALITSLITRTYAYAMLSTIDYLQRSGRMSSIQYTVIGLLGIKPIMRMNDHVAKMEVARTSKRAYERVLNVAKDALPQSEILGISHANAPEAAARLVQDLRSFYPEMPEPIISEVTPALGAHVGPGALCLNWIEDPDKAEPEKKGLRKWFH